MALRILFTHSGTQLDGEGRMLFELVDGLIVRGHTAIVVIPGKGPLHAQLEAAGAHVRVQPLGELDPPAVTLRTLPKALWRTLRATVALIRRVREEPVDLIQTHTTRVFSGALAALLTATPHVWHLHDVPTAPRAVWRTVSWLVARLSARVVCGSIAACDHLVGGATANHSKALVIYNGISPLQSKPDARWRVRAALTLSDATVLVGVVGGDAALAELKEQGLTGDSISVLKVDASSPDLADLLCALDVFVLPDTRPDPFATVVLEAMFAGLPIVGFAQGTLREIVDQGVTGSLANTGEAAALCAAIAPYLKDPERRRLTGQRARERVMTKFSRKSLVGQFEALYQQLARRA